MWARPITAGHIVPFSTNEVAPRTALANEGCFACFIVERLL
jgi:hypothetical protein